jgi:hypothetical protein
MLAPLIKQAREACEEALREPALRSVERGLEQNHVNLGQLLVLVQGVSELASTQRELEALKMRLIESTRDLDETAVARYALIQAARLSLDKLHNAPLYRTVQALICKKIHLFANPDDGWLPQFRIGSASFIAMCKIATLRRFPAGQLDWEVSGLPRSWILRVRPKNLPRLLQYVTTRFGGFGPAFFSHVALHKSDSLLLMEREMGRSYYRMAKCLEIQPSIRGFLTSSWFYSEETFRVSPHLNWLTRVFQENGGIVLDMGPAPLDSGVFTRSPERRTLYESGQFKPTNALVLWGRNEMIKWSSNHPEFGD